MSALHLACKNAMITSSLSASKLFSLVQLNIHPFYISSTTRYYKIYVVYYSKMTQDSYDFLMILLVHYPYKLKISNRIFSNINQSFSVIKRITGNN